MKSIKRKLSFFKREAVFV